MIEIVDLTASSSRDLFELLNADPLEYRATFHGFGGSEESIRSEIEKAKKDLYWLLKVEGEIAGFFMMRGMDAGYKAPSFGIYVRKQFSGKGLAQLALSYSLCTAKLLRIEEMMLTSEDHNLAGLQIYQKAGFIDSGERSPKGLRIYRKKLI